MKRLIVISTIILFLSGGCVPGVPETIPMKLSSTTNIMGSVVDVVKPITTDFISPKIIEDEQQPPKNNFWRNFGIFIGIVITYIMLSVAGVI